MRERGRKCVENFAVKQSIYISHCSQWIILLSPNQRSILIEKLEIVSIVTFSN